MKRNLAYFIGFSLALAGWSGCNDTPPPPVPPQNTPPKREQPKQPQQTQLQLDKMQIMKPIEVPKGQLTPTDLVKFLPGELGGGTLESPSGGKNRRSETAVWTLATGQYRLPGGGAAYLAITDYGGALPADMDKRFDPPFKEAGLVVESLTTPNGTGYRLYNEQAKNGVIAVLVSGRIGIEIEVMNFAGRNFDAFLSAIDVEGLAKAARKK